MKTRLFLLLFIITSSVSGQIEAKQLIGLWRYENTTNLNNVVVESSVKNFDFYVKSNKIFEMSGEDYSISGEWSLDDGNLILKGTRSDTQETNTEKIPLHNVSNSMLSFKLRSETDEPLIVNLIKVE